MRKLAVKTAAILATLVAIAAIAFGVYYWHAMRSQKKAMTDVRSELGKNSSSELKLKDCPGSPKYSVCFTANLDAKKTAQELTKSLKTAGQIQISCGKTPVCSGQGTVNNKNLAVSLSSRFESSLNGGKKQLVSKAPTSGRIFIVD